MFLPIQQQWDNSHIQKIKEARDSRSHHRRKAPIIQKVESIVRSGRPIAAAATACGVKNTCAAKHAAILRSVGRPKEASISPLIDRSAGPSDKILSSFWSCPTHRRPSNGPHASCRLSLVSFAINPPGPRGPIPRVAISSYKTLNRRLRTMLQFFSFSPLLFFYAENVLISRLMNRRID